MIDHGFIGKTNMDKKILDAAYKHLNLLNSYFEKRFLFTKKVYWDLTNNKVFIGMERHRTDLTVIPDFYEGVVLRVKPERMLIEYEDGQTWHDYGNVDWDHTIEIGDF